MSGESRSVAGESLAWFKSRRCAESASCVEVAYASDGVFVRNSRDPHGTTIGFDAATWTAFLGDVKQGTFDLRDPHAPAECAD